MPENRDLTALLGSRICHDLISPLGAIGNGVELLMMTGAAASPEIALIAESVANANAKIRYFRVAYGISSLDQRIGRTEIFSILSETTKGGRLGIEWNVPGDLPRAEVKLAFLLLQCCETAMPYGGKVSVTRDDGRWRIDAAALKMKIDADMWDALSNPSTTQDISSAQVHFALVPPELRRQNRALTVDLREAAIVLAF